MKSPFSRLSLVAVIVCGLLTGGCASTGSTGRTGQTGNKRVAAPKPAENPDFFDEYLNQPGFSDRL